MHQLSRMSLLVPVFTAAKPRVARALARPKVRARALLSARMSVTRKTAAGSATRTGRAAAPPLRSIAGEYRPPLASVR
jgi:hypothetical protein